MKSKFQRKGFTFIELLIVIIIIGVLAGMMMMSSDEAATSARAAKIISDLENIKTAVNQWYLYNRSKVATRNSSNKYKNAKGEEREEQKGKIIINGKIGSPQHYTGSELGLYEYFTGPVILINQVSGDYGSGVGQAASELKPGNYGFYDQGTREDNSTLWNTRWLVGYCFKDDEDKVKEKLAKRQNLGLEFTRTPDPWDRMNPNSKNYYDNHKLKNIKDARAVWMIALDLIPE